MKTDPRTRLLQRHLFPAEEGLSTYAILDGASVEGLLEHLEQDHPEHVCLYRGELAPDLAECAPYLVRIEPDQPFTEWVLGEGWGKHWGIFAVAPADMKAMRKHFRTFLMVKDPDGKQLYFRYYDPRVLRVYLPTCNAAETATLFGPIRNYACEDEDGAALLQFWPDRVPPRLETTKLGLS